MKQTTADRIQKLTDEAMAKIGAKYTITLQDRTTRKITETGYRRRSPSDITRQLLSSRREGGLTRHYGTAGLAMAATIEMQLIFAQPDPFGFTDRR